MLFNSWQFLVFFPIVTVVYFILPARWRYLWLLAASYFFYMCWNAKYVVLILFSTVVTYASGRIMEWLKEKDCDRKRVLYYKKLCVAGSVGLNLALLFFFKYLDFAVINLNRVLSLIHLNTVRQGFDLMLPVGISFYTFQALSYTIDVYRDEISAEKNFFRYALFVSFFPQLVAGPIERSKNLLKQLREPASFDFNKARDGFLLMLWGFFLKLVIADRIALYVDYIYRNYYYYTGWYIVIAVLLFGVQLYCDFYGYSVIAMGAAEILGISLMENFNAPFLSQSVSEFWRRWHISLSSWFKDYLYIPLGGSRIGKVRNYINKMLVFLVSGLWHGAQWNFVIWGGLNGICQVIGQVLMPVRNKLVKLLGLRRETFSHKLFHVIGTALLFDFSLIFFRSETLSMAFGVLKNMLSLQNIWILFDGSLYECGLDRANFLLLVLCIGVLLCADICKHRGIQIRRELVKQEYWFRWLVIVGTVVFILVFGIWGAAYSSANFIYFQF